MKMVTSKSDLLQVAQDGVHVRKVVLGASSFDHLHFGGVYLEQQLFDVIERPFGDHVLQASPTR